jgi:hypothetical protein
LRQEGGHDAPCGRRNRRVEVTATADSGEPLRRPGGGSERGKESERRGDRGDLIEKVLMAFNSREVTGGVTPATLLEREGNRWRRRV